MVFAIGAGSLLIESFQAEKDMPPIPLASGSIEVSPPTNFTSFLLFSVVNFFIPEEDDEEETESLSSRF